MPQMRSYVNNHDASISRRQVLDKLFQSGEEDEMPGQRCSNIGSNKTQEENAERAYQKLDKTDSTAHRKHKYTEIITDRPAAEEVLPTIPP